MLYRFNLDLAIPEAVFDKISQAKKQTFVKIVREMKALAVKINEGLPNEEITVRAVWHRCHHDTGDRPCETEEEI